MNFTADRSKRESLSHETGSEQGRKIPESKIDVAIWRTEAQCELDIAVLICNGWGA
jgi:hypothetical protein